MRLNSWLAAFQWRFLNSTSRWNRSRRWGVRQTGSVEIASTMIELLETRRLLSGTTITVTTNADSGTGSLRAAINTANSTVDPAAVTINFNLAASGVSSTINLQSPLPAISHAVIIDGTSEPGYSAAVVPLPAGVPLVNLDGTSAGNFAGFFIDTGNSTVKGLGFKNFHEPAIALVGDGTAASSGNFISNNVIEQCQVAGIQAFDSASTTISNNVVSGNVGQGIVVKNSSSSTISGNFVGTDRTGTVKEANTLQGILVTDSSTVTVSANIVSGNGDVGILVQLVNASTASGMNVSSNIIGTDITGTQSLGNGSNGILLNGVTQTIVQLNQVSGNGGIGIALQTANQNTILSNFVGTNASGTQSLGNKEAGVLLLNSSGNAISQNLVSGNGFDGVSADGQGWSGISLQGTSSFSNAITRNFIGLNVSGSAALANDSDGISIMSGAHDNTIGGTGVGNLISGNRANGITIGDPSNAIPTSLTKNNLVFGNFIGTDGSGSTTVQNAHGGVEILNSPGNVIGDSSGQLFSESPLDLKGNLISGNVSDGVSIVNTANVDVTNNKIQDNFVGTNIAGTRALGNGGDGIHLDGASTETIGGAVKYQNIIAGNSLDEIFINNSAGIAVDDNIVGGGRSGTIVDPVGHSGINLNFSPDASVVGNAIIFCATAGILRTDDPNLISQNAIFHNYTDGTQPTNAGGIDGVDSNAGVPKVNSAFTSGAKTHIQGQLTGALPNTSFTIEAFSDDAATATAAEGKTYFGSVTGTTDATGSATFEVISATAVTASQFIRITSTVSHNGTFDTSQFSANPQTPIQLNHAPQGTSNTVTFAENSTYAIKTADFGFSDPNDNPQNGLLAVKITTLPTVGALVDGTTTVTLNQVISAADIAAGNLKFTSASQAFGAAYGNLSFQVQDNGGTAAAGANLGVDTDPIPKTLTFNVAQNILSMALSANPVVAGQPETITVSVKDSLGNLFTSENATVTLKLLSGTFADGMTSKALLAVGGLAKFSNLSFNTSGSYSLTASDQNYTTATASLVVTPAAASKVVITQAPTTGSAGTPLPPLIAKIEDTFGNVVTGNTSPVTLSLATFPAGAIFDPASTLTANAVAGVATFDDFELNTAGAYTLKAAAPGLASATTSTLTISPDLALKVVITQSPTTGVAGTVLGVSLVAKIEDFFGNVVTGDTSQVTLSLATFPVGATFAPGSVLTAKAVAGVATFSNLKLNVAGTYTINATDGLLTFFTTNAVTISPAAASKVVMTQGLTTGLAGASLGTVVAKIEDAFGNVLTDSTASVKLSLSAGNRFVTGTNLTDSTLTVAAIKGVATFSSVKIATAGNQTITATAASLAPATTTVTVRPLAATKVVITQIPTTGIAGVAGTLIAKLQDTFGNVVTTNTSLVTLRLASGPDGIAGLNPSTFASGLTLTANAVGGVATFSNVTFNKAGVYTITATDGTLTASTSGNLTISPAAAAQIVLLSVPSEAIVYNNFTDVPIGIQDQFGNPVSPVSNVTLMLSSGKFSTGLASATVATVGGVATFSTLRINTLGRYTVTVSDAALPQATFTVAVNAQFTSFQQGVSSVTSLGVAGLAATAQRTVYLTGNNVTSSDLQLWSVDSTTAANPLRLKDFGRSAGNLTVRSNNGRLIFTINVSQPNVPNAATLQMWSTDGTVAGTVLLSNFGNEATTVDQFENFNGFEMFVATNVRTRDVKLVSTQGTISTTTVHDFGTTANLAPLGDANGIKFYQASFPASHDLQIWGTSGSAATAIRIRDFGTNLDLIDQFDFHGRQFLILKDRTTTDVQLWGSDGTVAGTKLLQDFGQNVALTIGDQIGNFQLLRLDNSQTHQSQIWGTDGTVDGTRLLINFGSSGFRIIESSTGFEYFDKSDGLNSNIVSHQLWGTDGTPAHSLMLKNFGVIGIGPVGIVAHESTNGRRALFEIPGQNTRALWGSDGTVAGTVQLHQFNSSTSLTAEGAINGIDMFLIRSASTQLWGTDGTVPGTVLLRDLGTTPVQFTRHPVVNGRVLFELEFQGGATQIWSTNGTSTGTIRLFDFSDKGSFNLTDIGNVGGFELFQLDNTSNGDSKLLKTQGTLATSRTVHDFGDHNTLQPLENAPGLFIVTDSASQKLELWGIKPDLSDAVLLNEFQDNRIVTFIGTVNGMTLLDVSTPDSLHTVTNHQLWGTNGLPTGTSLLHDFERTEFNVVASVNGTVIIEADVPGNTQNTIQLWGTDGTVAGTSLDHNFGQQNSGTKLTVIDNFNSFAFFSLFDRTTTRFELWEIS